MSYIPFLEVVINLYKDIIRSFSGYISSSLDVSDFPLLFYSRLISFFIRELQCLISLHLNVLYIHHLKTKHINDHRSIN